MTLRRTSYELKWGGIWSRPVWFDLVWSCGTRLPSPVDDWEARPLSYWNTPEKTHERHLQFLTSSFVSHTGTGGGRGGSESCPWSELCVTYLLNVRRCIFIRPPPAEERREEVLNVAFQLFIQVFFKHCSLSPLQPPPSTYFKMWTCQSNTSMSNPMWLNIFFSLFKPVNENLDGSCLSRTRGYCGTSCVDFSYTTLFQLCENKMTFLLQK